MDKKYSELIIRLLLIHNLKLIKREWKFINKSILRGIVTTFYLKNMFKNI